MCTNPDCPWPARDGSFNYDYDSIIKRLKKDKGDIKNQDSIYLSGGEPTLHPCFFDIINYLKENFPEQKIKLLTNARRFIYPDFARKFLKIAGDLEIDVSLYGPTKEIHNKVTRAKNSFEQTAGGLKNLLRYKTKKQVIGLRIVITKFSYKHLKDILALVKSEFPAIDRVIIIFPELEGQALKNLEKIKITYSRARPYIEKTFPLLKNFKEMRFYHFPLCTLNEKFWPYIWRTLPDEEVEFIKICHSCNFKKYCQGIHKNYLENIGKTDFSSIKRKISVKETENFYKPIK